MACLCDAFVFCSTPAAAAAAAAAAEASEEDDEEAVMTYFERINRGGLIRPSALFLLLSKHCYRTLQLITGNDAYMCQFLGAGKQSYVLLTIYMSAAKAIAGDVFGPLYMDCTCDNCEDSDREDLLAAALSCLVNVQLNNYTKRMTDEVRFKGTEKEREAEDEGSSRASQAQKATSHARKLSTLHS